MKTSIAYLNQDVNEIQDYVKNQQMTSRDELLEEIDSFEKEALATLQGILNVQEYCHQNEIVVQTEREVLILYCQQFAYAPEINSSCAKILNCKDCAKPFRYQFGHLEVNNEEQKHREDSQNYQPQGDNEFAYVDDQGIPTDANGHQIHINPYE